MFDYFFLTYDIKIFPTNDIENYKVSCVISFVYDILRRITTFFERHSVFFVVTRM